MLKGDFMKKNSTIIKVLTALIVPLITFIVCEILSMLLSGKTLFSSSFDVYSLMTGLPVTIISAYALSINMSTGRMDLSLGGQQLMGVIFGGNLALSLGLGPIGIIVLSMICGAVTGLLSGLIFTTLRIDAFILGLGLALVYEGVSINYSDNVLQIFESSITGVLSNKYFVFAIGVIIVVIIYFLMNKTVFGNNYNAIKGSQNLALNSGIKVNKNCVICYTICGALICLAGSLTAGINGVLSTTVNLGSVSAVFSGFLPVMLALYLVSFVPMEIGIPIGAVTCKLVSILLGKLSISSSYSTIFLMSTVFVIVIALNTFKNIELKKQYKHKGLVD